MHFFFLSIGLVSRSQQLHYVYLQTDNKQPFYVRLNEKVYSSSSGGYVVIPKLTEGTYTLSVGFPKNEWPVQSLKINVAGKDMGYALKNFGARGWGLFNLQTLEVINSFSASPETASVTTGKTDDFSNVLADVVNTPSIKEEKKKVPEPVTPVKQEQPATEPVRPVEKSKKSTVVKVSSAYDADGIVLTYHDKQTSVTDTINIFIPGTETISKEKKPEPVLQAREPEAKPVPAVAEKTKEKPSKSTETVNTPKFIDLEMPVGNTDSMVNKTPAETTLEKNPSVTVDTKAEKPGPGPVMINSDCKQIATEDDFFKTRKKMASEKTDDAMVTAASKMFKQKCYSTEQVKNLSVLLLGDEGKYKLFDVAYPHVFDTNLFRQLESQLTDQYIIKRFRAMLRN